MDTKLQTGLLLVLGPIVSLVGWMFLYPVGGDSGEYVKQASDLVANSEVAQIGMILGFGGMITAAAGLFNISRRMSMGGGAGSSYANIATVLSLVAIGTMVMGVGFNFAASNAASVSAAVPLVMVGEAGGAGMFPLGMGVLLALVGIAIALEKNYHVTVAGLFALGGVLMIVGFFVGGFSNEGSDNLFSFIGWAGWMISSIVLGVLRLRASD
mgnify:FL=1